MRIALGMLAFTLVGADAPAPLKPPGAEAKSQPAPAQIGFHVRVLEVCGVDWRAEVYPQLDLVCRQGGSTVWTLPAEAANRLTKKLEADPRNRWVASPKVVTAVDQPSHVFLRSQRPFVADVERTADGPVNHASYVAYTPRMESAEQGFLCKVKGRKLDQGVLAQIAIEEAHVNAVHPVELQETQEAGGDRKSWHSGVKLEVPEVSHCSLGGEWLVPKKGVLLVSMCVSTVAGKDGKAEVRERLAVLEVQPVEPTPTASPAPTPLPVPAAAPAPVVAEAPRPVEPEVLPIPMPKAAPPVPSRMLPQPKDASGKPVALPPLPEEHPAPTALPGTSDPCATPQTKGHKGVKPPVPEAKSTTPAVVDPDSAQASYSVEPPICTLGGDCCKDNPVKTAAAAGVQKAVAEVCCEDDCDEKPAALVEGVPAGATSLEPAARSVGGKNVLFRFPVSESIAIEVRASVKPKWAPGKPAESDASSKR
ncbi:MAG: hypothetical protein U0835_18960 [Isosphaeraceae bacterium]